MSFEVKKEQKDAKTFLKFFGHVDEDASFPIFNDLNGEIHIDLEEVKSINSVGIRSWIKWFSSFSGVQFVFHSCPKAIVMQMNMVEGFLPENTKVESIQVPFYCESCDEELNVLFNVGQQIIVEGDTVKLEYDKSSICPDGGDPELDASETKYFKFLLRAQASQSAA